MYILPYLFLHFIPSYYSASYFCPQGPKLTYSWAPYPPLSSLPPSLHWLMVVVRGGRRVRKGEAKLASPGVFCFTCSGVSIADCSVYRVSILHCFQVLKVFCLYPSRHWESVHCTPWFFFFLSCYHRMGLVGQEAGVFSFFILSPCYRCQHMGLRFLLCLYGQADWHTQT